jgi:hypothetical protein
MLFRRRERRTLAQRIRCYLWPRGGPQRGWLYNWHRMVRIAASPHAVAIGFAAGAFVSFTPYVGLHFALAALIALALGGSVVASAVGTLVGNPLTFPFIWLLTYDLGGALLGYETREKIDISLPEGTLRLILSDPSEFWRQVWGILKPVILPMSIGAIPLGLAGAAISYLLVRWAVAGYQRRRVVRLAARVRQ